MDHKKLSDIIGLLYDTAFSADMGLQLLEMMFNELAPLLNEEARKAPIPLTTVPADVPKSPSSKSSTVEVLDKNALSKGVLIDILRSHFVRAVQLNRRIFESNEECRVLKSLFDRLPVGLLVVDSESRVLTYNQKLNRIIAEHKGILIQNNVLSTVSPFDTTRIKRLIRAVAQDDASKGESYFLTNEEMAMPLLLFIVPYHEEISLHGVENDAKVLVLVTAPDMDLDISTDTLMSTYGLTKAEAKLVSSMINDCDLNTIAENFGISRNTVRNQLRSIFDKTGTHRQAELVRQVITGPAMFAVPHHHAGKTKKNSAHAYPSGSISSTTLRNHLKMKLPDGRTLGYAEYGLPNGRPWVLMHSLLGSRLELPPYETILRKCGIRLIIPERPGVGLSDHGNPPTFLNWTHDVECLADQLRLKRFGVMGHSLGSAFGLACAYKLKKRINRLVLVACVAPFENFKDLEGAYLPFRLVLSVGKYAHSLVEPFVDYFSSKFTHEVFQKDLLQILPPVDKLLINDVRTADRLMENLRQNSQRDKQATFQEAMLLCRDWGFDIGKIKTPIKIWHGKSDLLIPPALVQKMIKKLPNCESIFLPKAGHMMFFQYWKEILLQLRF